MSSVIKNNFDFSGYATKAGLKCADGRVIMRDAFKHQDGKVVPLVWQHCHDDPSNVLGHVLLENKEDGVYCYGKFNDTEGGKNAKELVSHGDVNSLSIYANKLKEDKKKVLHGWVREVSLVLSGANPGAFIDNVAFGHGDDGSEYIDDTEAIIFSGETLSHGEDNNMANIDNTYEEVFGTLNDEQKELVYDMIAHAATSSKKSEKEDEDDEDMTVKDVFDTLTEQQKKVVYYLIGTAMEDANKGSAKHDDLGGDNTMKSNVFDQNNGATNKGSFLSHDQLKTILVDAKRHGSLKESFLVHADEYGFDPVDILFPDAKDVPNGLQSIKRRSEWVENVLKNTNHTPFSRIKTRIADLTVEEARAKGYVTGNLKKESVIPLMKRVTTPTTVYKKEKLDRDDILDITEFEIVVWLKREMRALLDEELARAVLIGDGRIVGDENKINEENIRPIAFDNENLFIQRVQVENNATTEDIIDEIIRSRKFYKGSGNPSIYTSTDLLTEMLLVKDTLKHRMYKTTQELSSVLRVKDIVEVEPMNTAVRTVGDDDFEILAIVVNLLDYTIGADKGGEVNMFDDFDIDYNQEKFLIETRASGALTVPKSAIVIERKPA